jgi:hypothetical protein
MGYPTGDREFVLRVIAEESARQTSPEFVGRDLDYLRENARILIDLVNCLIGRDLLPEGPRGVEIGAAFGWAAWLLAEAGCEMWLCELEPNSLASGRAFEHPRIGEEARVVCDARFLASPTASSRSCWQRSSRTTWPIRRSSTAGRTACSRPAACCF